LLFACCRLLLVGGLLCLERSKNSTIAKFAPVPAVGSHARRPASSQARTKRLRPTLM